LFLLQIHFQAWNCEVKGHGLVLELWTLVARMPYRKAGLSSPLATVFADQQRAIPKFVALFSLLFPESYASPAKGGGGV
jgi:hypothetical protein